MFERLKSIFGYAKLEVEDVENLLVKIGNLAQETKMLRKADELQNILIDNEEIKGSIPTLIINDMFSTRVGVLTFNPNNFSKRMNKKIDKLFIKINRNHSLNKRDLRKFYRFSTQTIVPLRNIYVADEFNINSHKIIIL